MKFALLALASVQAVTLKQRSHEQADALAQLKFTPDMMKRFDKDGSNTVSWDELSDHINGMNIS